MKKILCIILTFLSYQVKSQIDLEIIKEIESAGDSLAYNKTDGGSRGLYQIAPTCLVTYNKITNHNYSLDDLYISRINKEIAVWMFDIEIPYLLKRCNVPNTLENRIIAYNAGISFLYHKKKIPKSTIAYIAKYKRLRNIKQSKVVKL